MTLLITSVIIFLNVILLLVLFMLLKRKNKQLVKAQELGKVRLDMWYADRVKLMDGEIGIKQLTDLVSHVGYAIHHLGQDIAYRRKDGIVNSENEPLRKLYGEAMAFVGNDMRIINTQWDSLTKQEKEFVCDKIGRSINDFIDNKPMAELIPGVDIKPRSSFVLPFDSFIQNLKNKTKLFFEELNSGIPYDQIDIRKYDRDLFSKYEYVIARDGKIANTLNSSRILSRSFNMANTISDGGKVVSKITYHYKAILPYLEYLEANGEFNNARDWEFYNGIINNLEKENKFELNLN